MSRYLDKYKSRTQASPIANAAAAEFEGMPNLSELMCGVMAQDGKAWEMPPHTLTIWLEGAQAKFAIGAGDFYDKCFGTFPGLSAGLQGVEDALEADRCEWKKAKGRK